MTTAAARRSIAVTGAIALVVAVQAALWWGYYAYGERWLLGDEQHYLDGAHALLRGALVHSNHLWPPLQAYFLAPWLALGGGLVLAQVVQMLLLGLAALLLARLWRHLDPRPAAGAVAALLMLGNPGVMAYGMYLWPEPLHLALELAALWLLTVGARRPGLALLAGLSVGLALLAKSYLSGFWPLLLLFFLRRPWKPHALAAGAFLAGLLAATAPSLWQGYRETGHVLIADSSAYNLYIGLTDRYRSDFVHDQGRLTLDAYLRSGDSVTARNAVYVRKSRELVAEQGLLHTLADQFGRQYFRLFSAKTLLITLMPGRACAGHVGAYPALPAAYQKPLTAWANLAHALTLVAFAFGVCLWRRWRSPLSWCIALLFVYELGLFLVLHVKARFLLPVWPMMCGFAGSALIGHWRGSEVLAVSRVRLALGTGLALLLLFLAFAGPWLDHACR